MSLRSLDWSRRRALAAVLAPVAGLGSWEYFASASPPDQRPKIIGHRGAAGLAPPNTVLAIRRALDHDVDGVEIDIRQTEDGEFVLYHDAVLDWESTGSGWISNVSLEEVRAARIEDEPIPTLSEGLEAIAEHPATPEVYLDIKSSGFTEEVIDITEQFGLLDQATVLSFSEEVLTSAQEAGLPTGFLGGVARPGVVESAVETNVDAVLCHYTPFMTSWFTEQAAEADLRSGVWKLGDTKRTIRNTLSADPDIVVTNRPDLVHEELAATDE